MLLRILLESLLNLLISATPSHCNPQKYHTLILSGHAWVLELTTGHPDRIHCELGLCREFFLALVAEF